MASPFEPCDACGRPIANHDIPLAVRVTVGTLPGTVDLDADELEADGLDEFLLSIFDLTDGIGGAFVVYGAECFSAATVTARDDEITRLKGRSARRRNK